MKRCPTCNRTYSADTFTFCLEDGALLSAPFDSEKTLVIQTPQFVPLDSERTIIIQTQPLKTYEYSRLCFKKAIIEPLSLSEDFRVITPVGTFQMSKAKFYEVFGNVLQSRSYKEHGIYHYPTVPEKARQFLL